MKRSEQARMLIGLVIPGSGPVAASRTRSSPERRSLALRRMPTSVRRWSHRHGLEGYQVGYFLTLLACGILFGLFVGGFVGFMENATPHVYPPYSFAQLAASDAGWTSRLRQDWLASRPPDSAAVGQRLREMHWQRLIRSAATDSGPGVLSRASTSATLGGHFVRLDAPAADVVPHDQNGESECEREKPTF